MVYDSALRSVTHSSTELSPSHNKSWGSGQSRNLNQAALMHNEAHPANSVLQRNSRKQITSLYCSLIADKRQHTDFDLSPILHQWLYGAAQHGRRPSGYQLGASLDGTRSSRSVISTAPPAAIVHPVGPACVTFFYYTLTRSCCLCFLWHWAHSYRSVFTKPLQDIEKCPNWQLKLTIELEDWCFSTQSGVKCIRFEPKHIRI